VRLPQRVIVGVRKGTGHSAERTPCPLPISAVSTRLYLEDAETDGAGGRRLYIPGLRPAQEGSSEPEVRQLIS